MTQLHNLFSTGQQVSKPRGCIGQNEIGQEERIVPITGNLTQCPIAIKKKKVQFQFIQVCFHGVLSLLIKKNSDFCDLRVLIFIKGFILWVRVSGVRISIMIRFIVTNIWRHRS